MKRKFRFLGLGLACILSASCFYGCGETQQEVVGYQDGTIEYESATCDVIVGVENSGTVATATASNGAPIKYSISDEEQEKLNNAFGSALSIAPDGAILGKYDKTKKFKIEIQASAEKCETVTASITINVINPYLDYTGKTLTDARENIPYAAAVTYTGSANVTSYKLVSGQLPAGLTLNTSTGVISGTPTKVSRGTPFTISISAKGYSETRADFIIDVVLNHVSEATSKIVNFGSSDNSTVVLEPAFIGTQYVNQSGVCGKASALNNNNITYTLAEGSELPEGYTLYPNGALFGSSDAVGEYEFTVEASAHMCETCTCTFKLPVQATKIQYASLSGELTKGEEANYPLNTAVAEEGTKIKYSMTADDAAKLKAEYGLTLTEEGYLTGVPTKVVMKTSIKVTASADGYTPTTTTMYFRINEPLQAPADGKFEAEYVDLTGKAGTGYSASPTGVNLIDYEVANKYSCSNSAFVNYLHNDSITLEFVIYAEDDVNNAPLYLALGSELGNITLTPDVFGVYTYVGKKAEGDKTTVSYGSVTVSGGNEYTSFNSYKFGTVSLKKGWNVVQLAVHSNSFMGEGKPGGPGVDYISIDTSVSLKWVPCTYNMDK